MATATASSSRIIDSYRKRTPGSARLARQAQAVFPDGVTHDARHLEPYGIYVTRAQGSHKWDVDDNEYVDYAGGHGALLLGHNHPQVTQAVEEQIQRGTHFGANHELEVRWGQLVQKMVPCAEKVRFVSSGTEATLLGMRLARAFTGRGKILRFVGHFHGWHDHAAFGVGSHFDGTPTPGVLSGVCENVVLAPAGDIEATRRILSDHEIACVMIEPTGSSWGHVPVAPDFLHALKKLTHETGALLFFDEVITGFRCSPGGAQQALGIKPDLCSLAKILAGGLPGGAIAGRADVLDVLNHDRPKQSKGQEKVAHHGTFNANPLSAAAGVAALDIIRTTDACERANRFADELRREMNRILAEEGVDWVVYGTYSSFHIFTNPKHLSVTADDLVAGKLDYHAIKGGIRRDLVTKLRLAMMLFGVEIFVWPGGPTSAVHTSEDLERTCEAFGGALRLLKEDGEIE